MLINSFYYLLKPFIPRRLQISMRRKWVIWRRLLYLDVWPIDKKAGTPPTGWSGWPNQKRFALVLTHDVDTSNGSRKCYPLIRLEESLGFKSSFNFVSEEYCVSAELRDHLVKNGFEVGLHGLNHKQNPFKSKKVFQKQIIRINRYLKEWKSVGFRAPCMFHDLDWIHDINIEYDASTFDTDPFEPQPDGIRAIFPFWVQKNGSRKGYAELPYTLPQDFTLFVLMKERNIDIWKQKLDWIVENRGMALLITHPDYMNFGSGKLHYDEYPVEFYAEFLDYIKSKYAGQYWHTLPKEMAKYCSDLFRDKSIEND